MEIILFEPQIPQNTGNIVRTCSVTGTKLTLIHPLGFRTDAKSLKRAGLDYWEGVEVSEERDLFAYLEQEQRSMFFFSSKADKSYTEVVYPENCRLIFGSETTGLPIACNERWKDFFVKIPMKQNARCLNLATSVGIGLYEALRQQRSAG